MELQGTYTPDDLISGNPDVSTREVVVAQGEVLTRGTLLGLKTADSEAVISAAASVDGTEAPSLILAEDVDATDGAVVATAYDAGGINENRVTYGAGHTADSTREALRGLGIYLKPSVA